MTSYWKPRWANTVLFGSFRELNYRIDIGRNEGGSFCVRTRSGPGFHADITRSNRPPGFEFKGGAPPRADEWWLGDDSFVRAIAGLLETHFSRMVVRPDSIECHCLPSRDDILPEGGQLTWCLSLIHCLWSAVPEAERGTQKRSEFIR